MLPRFGRAAPDPGGESSGRRWREPQPASSGVWLRTGCRQSIPSSNIESCAAVIAATPSSLLRRNGLRQALQGDETSIDMVGAPGSQAEALAIGDEFILRVPTRLKLCSGEMRLVIPPGNVRELRPRPNATLIKALARAHAWKEKLFSGQAPSIQTIAKAEGVTPRYVGRIIRLAFLAPDIVEAILEGYQPADLELERLMKGIPIGWQEQRRVIGLSRG